MIGSLRRYAALIAFGVVEVIAFVAWLSVGRSDWVYIDEWDFLAGRKAGDLGDLFRPHNGHWTTLPLLTFRLLYSLFALRTYVPYRVVVIVLYLTAGGLLLAVMRRAGVHPWIATAAAALFALFGAGWENIILPFQIAFTGSLVFGLSYLLLADHDGPFAGRDRLGLVAGLLGLMCSGVGLVMAAVVGAAVFMRRGWRLALLHVVPLATVYVVWLAIIGHTGSAVGHFTAAGAFRFARTGYQAFFGALGPIATFGALWAIVLVVGLVLATTDRRRSLDLAELAAPAALLVGSLVLLIITAINRAGFGADWARQSRYVSLVAALTLPALAVAADAAARRWKWGVPVAAALFLAGVPANLHAATHEQQFLRVRDRATRATMLSLPLDPLARHVPRSVRPEPTTAGAVTIGWLLDAAAHHQLPRLGPLTPRLRRSDDFRLSFARPNRPAPSTNCRSQRAPLVLDLHRGDEMGVYDNGVYLEPTAATLVGLGLFFAPADNAAIVALRAVGPVRVSPVLDGAFRVCTTTG